MKRENINSPEAVSLREKAEKQITRRHSRKTGILSEADTLKLFHELEVHQIELEMQNEELSQARNKAKTTTEKFTTLYDFASSGFFTLCSDSKICELNLSGASMLGKDRSSLLHRYLKQFVTLDTLTIFNEFLRKVFETNFKETCEIRLINTGKPSIFVHMEGIVSEEEQNCFVTVVDISKRKLAEEVLMLKANELEQYNDLLRMSELKMVALKKEINLLLNKLGEKDKFEIDE